MRLRFVVFTVVAVLGLVVPATLAGATAPPDVVCGQTITTSVVLRSNLTCSGDALIIGASNVTVRLAGHRITSSDGTGTGIRFGVPATGTTPAVCVDDALVHGGRISGFFAGIAGDSCGSGNRVSGLTLTGNTWGAFLRQSFPLAVDHTIIVGPNGIGGPFAPGSPTGSADVSHSRIDVTSPGGFSVLSALAGPSHVDSSRLVGGLVDTIGGGSMNITNSHLDGVTVACGDADVSITKTRVVGGGILSASACGYSLSDDRFIGPGSGVAVALGSSAFDATISDSVFTGWDTAITVGNVSATITGNTFRRNGMGVVACPVPGCDGTVSGNSFVDNRGAGLVLSLGTWHVGSNVALRNGGLGIDAEGPQLTVIDDGGNVARRNLPPQCVGVVCTPGP